MAKADMSIKFNHHKSVSDTVDSGAGHGAEAEQILST